ncbi:MAG: sensor histidine kinase [Gammaproteobacteria bacterium]|nr:sensor histidine kinase [Gammaproteobacteria bacterium]
MNIRVKPTYRPLVVTVGLLIVLAAALTAIDFRSNGLLWINLYWLFASAAAVAISLVNFPKRSGVKREVRSLLFVAFSTYFAGELVWAIQVLNGWNIVPGPSDAFFLAAPLVATAAALLAVRKLNSNNAMMITIFDTVTMFLAFALIAVTLFAPDLGNIGKLDATVLLLYPILYLSPAAGFLIISLAVAEKPRLGSSWLLLIGAVILGSCFLVWTTEALAGTQSIGLFVDYAFGIGVIVASLGAASLDSVPATSSRLVKWLRTLAEILPLVAIIVAISVLLLVPTAGPVDQLGWPVAITLLTVNGVRQIWLNRLLEESRQDLRSMAYQLTNSQDRERRQIAEYIHDRIGQSITVLGLKFRALKNAAGGQQNRDLFAEIESLITEVAKDTRTTTFDLSPPTLNDLGLASTISALAKLVRGQSELEIRVIDYSGDRRFEPDVERMLYRFTRELLLNVVKHAHATKVIIRIRCRDNTIGIDVKDNGCGFDPSTIGFGVRNPKFGLYSVQEGVQAMGGRMRVYSQPHLGTSAKIRIPL